MYHIATLRYEFYAKFYFIKHSRSNDFMVTEKITENCRCCTFSVTHTDSRY